MEVILREHVDNLGRRGDVVKVAAGYARNFLLPRKLALLLGGTFAGELLIAMALSVSLRAFGDHLRLPILIVVITLAGILGGIAPSPGGMGVVEAGLILGLTAAGVSEADATAAVFIQRLFTSYLPPIWGWATLVWMRKREYI